MYTIDKPKVAIADILKSCVGAISDTGLQNRIAAVCPTLEALEPAYDAMAMAATLHLIPRVDSVGAVSKDELVALYSDHLSATKAAARIVYDTLKGAARNRLCPLCSIGTVAHIDHHLPKRKYPDLSVLPINLVPACHFCNDTKKARFPKFAGEQTFHPYYDEHLLQAQWITAALDRGPPPVFVFSTSAPTGWSQTDKERVARHFKICGLATSFATNANNLLESLKERLLRLERRGGANEVKAHLEEERDIYAVKPNNWQHVAYQALAADDWFINGGFHTIA